MESRENVLSWGNREPTSLIAGGKLCRPKGGRKSFESLWLAFGSTSRRSEPLLYASG